MHLQGYHLVQSSVLIESSCQLMLYYCELLLLVLSFCRCN